MSGISDKSLNESLIAFNNHIVSMKNVVKKAKIIQMQKIVRKIKLFDKKKGTEHQIEKNKRKCAHLKQEIELIKNLKFNEVAIFAIENESIQFEEYIKNNKIKDIQTISLARIGLSKPLRQAVDKLKNDEKINSWKHTFIQYKSRLEKKKNWKEKSKLFKELEDKLLAKKNEQNEDVEPIDQETTLNNDVVKENLSSKLTSKQIDELIRKDNESNKSKREVKFSDSEDEEDDDDEDDDDDKDDNEDVDEDENEANLNSEDDVVNKNGKRNRKLTSSGDDYEEEESDNVREEESEQEETNTEKKNLNSSKSIQNEFKPLLITKKPAHMEIKQINLDQLKDLNEIPIESKSDVIEEEQDFDKQMTVDDDFEKVDTIRVNEDPFFLDPNGNEIQNPHLEEENHKFYERSKKFNRTYNELDDENLMSYSSYDRYKNKRKNLAHSSFKNALSSSSDRFDPSNGINNRNNSFRNDYRDNKNNFRKNESDGRNFNKNSNTRFGNQDRKFKNNHNDREYGKYNNGKERNTSLKKDEKPSLDVANLHPSWQAKKNMEEKLKALKFEGKKITFDD